MRSLPPTRLVLLGRNRALAVIAALAAAIAGFIASSSATWMPVRTTDASGTDFDLYAAVVARLRAGEPYYSALGIELTARGYPTGSVFNWRTPFHFEAMAAFPSEAAIHATLGVLALVACAAAFVAARRDCGGVAAALVALTLGIAFLPLAFTGVWLVAEAPSGLLVVLSAALLAGERTSARLAGIAAAIAALFVREIALPFVVVAFAATVVVTPRRDRVQTLAQIGWLAGIAGFAIYFWLHSAAVREHSSGAAISGASWLRLGGLPFILNVVRSHPLLLGLPPAATAIALPIAVLGLVAARGRFAAIALATALAYGCTFAIVGQAYNPYWGWVVDPLLLAGLGFAPAALRDLTVAAASGRRP